MRHLDDIKALIAALKRSDTFHALVIESPPGWAKSSTVEKALIDSNFFFVSLGNYSTPLSLYNSIAKNSEQILVLDDCAGLFGETTAMSVLKAATWATAGTSGGRKISWMSHSDRVAKPEIVFNGKLILLTNAVPTGRETQAFLSRTLYLKIAFDVEEVEKMLTEAANSSEHYKDTELALSVAHFLLSNLQKYDLKKINLRTLKMGYEIAKSDPDQWRSLLDRLLPHVSPVDLVRTLSDSDMTVEEQSQEFNRATGLSRRTFFYYRQGKAAGGIQNTNVVGQSLISANCTGAHSGATQ